MKKQPRQTDVNVEALTQKLAGANKRLEQFKQQIEQLRTVYSEKGGFDWTDFLSLIKVIEHHHKRCLIKFVHMMHTASMSYTT